MSGVVNRLSSNVRLTSVGQNGKYSARADAFRFASKFGHCTMRSALRICARNRHCYRSVTQARLLAAEVGSWDTCTITSFLSFVLLASPLSFYRANLDG